MEMTLKAISLNPTYYQNQTWSILVRCMTNIFNTFLTQGWKLETSSRPFYGFVKIKIKQYLTIINSWHLYHF